MRHISYAIQVPSSAFYNTPYYNMDLDIKWSCCGSQIFFIMEFCKGILCKIVPL